MQAQAHPDPLVPLASHGVRRSPPSGAGWPTVLVLGATGGLGCAVAQTLLAQGWPVRALSRQPDMAQRLARGDAACPGLAGVQWLHGDAMQASDVLRAAQGAAFIVHALNPPGYVRWRERALPMLQASLAAARDTGARLVFPGNVYNFGPQVVQAHAHPADPGVPEDAPQHPVTRKGAVRVEMEAMLEAASLDGRRAVRSWVLRAGDYFGPHAPASWMPHLMVKPGRVLGPGSKVIYPGVPEVGHTWAYLPDLAATLVQLMALDLSQAGRLASFDVLHFAGHDLAQGIEMAQAICRVAGVPSSQIRRLPWLWLTALAPIVPVLREIREMRYLWQQPLRLDGRKLANLLGQVPHTPLDVAVRATLQGLGCLGPGPSQVQAGRLIKMADGARAP